MSKQLRNMPKKFKRKVLLIVGGLSAIATGAFAAVLITAAIGGSMTTVAKPTVEWTDNNGFNKPKVVSTDGSGITCTPTLSSGKLNVVIDNAMPGSSCRIQSHVVASADGLKLQNIDMPGLTVKTANVGAGAVACGAVLKTAPGNAVTMDLTVPEGTTAGTKPITGQLTAVPQAQYDPALCNN